MSTHETSSRLRSPENVVSTAAVGVRCAEYIGHDPSGEAQTLAHAIAGLRVRATGSSEAPIFHPANGIYGFRDLAPGTHRVHIEDPQDRFLPRAVEVTVDPNLPAWRQALARGQRPDWSSWEPVVHVPLYPSAGRTVPPADTVVFGDVIVDGAELGFARIEIDAPAGRKIVTYTDRNGSYLAWLHHERSQVSTGGSGSVQRTFTRDVRLFRLRNVAPNGLGLHDFPVDFDTAANPAHWQALTISPAQVQFDIGERQRFSIRIP